MSKKSYIQKLTDFIENGYLLRKGQPPKINEPFYGKYMYQKYRILSSKLGCRIKVVYKEYDGKTSEYNGILISSPNGYGFELLTSGKKVWQSRDNKKELNWSRIIELSVVEEASPNFNIFAVNPDYRTTEEILSIIEEEHRLENKKPTDAESIKLFQNAYPGKDISSCKLLNCRVNLYWPYDGVVSLKYIAVLNEELVKHPIPETKIRHIYPNKDYFTICGVKQKDNFLMVFDTMEELQAIKYITCMWEVTLEPGQKICFLQNHYPTFKQDESDHNIFNIVMTCCPLQYCAENLHDNGLFLDNYDTLGVASFENDSYGCIKGGIPENEEMDFAMSLHGNNLQNVVESLCESSLKNDYIEFFITHETILPKRYASDFHDMSLKETHDFTKLLQKEFSLANAQFNIGEIRAFLFNDEVVLGEIKDSYPSENGWLYDFKVIPAEDDKIYPFYPFVLYKAIPESSIIVTSKKVNMRELNSNWITH